MEQPGENRGSQGPGARCGTFSFRRFLPGPLAMQDLVPSAWKWANGKILAMVNRKSS